MWGGRKRDWHRETDRGREGKGDEGTGRKGRYLRPTQPSIPPGLVNEYQLRLGRKRQVWFIPLADERGVCRLNCEIP